MRAPREQKQLKISREHRKNAAEEEKSSAAMFIASIQVHFGHPPNGIHSLNTSQRRNRSTSGPAESYGPAERTSW